MRGMQPYVDMKHQGARLNLTFDAGDVIFDAMGSFRDLQYNQMTGSSAGVMYDGFNFNTANPDQFGGNFWDTNSQSIVAEVRAYAPDTARLRWTVGAFYFDERQDAFLGQTSDPHAGYGGGEFNMPGVKGGSIAGYADATFDVVEDFRILGGARVTHETKSRKGGLWAIWTGMPGSFGRFGSEGFRYKGFDRPTYSRGESVTERVNFFLDGIASFGARDEVPNNLCNDPVAAAPGEVQQPRIALNNEGNFRCTNGVRDSLANAMTPEEGTGIYPVVAQNNEVENTFFDWRGGVEYDLAADNLLYATVSTGHKAGGFNDTQAVAGFGPLFNSEYDPESMIAFEIGSKNVFADRKLRLNGSAFFYTYSDLVFQTIVSIGDDPTPNDPTTGPPASAVRQNADAAASVFGLDLDLNYRLPAGLEAEVHVLLMDSRFGDGTTVDDSRLGLANPYVVDIGGNSLPRSSAATINYALSQLIFTAAGSFNWVAQAQTRTEHFLSVFNGNGTGLLPPANGEPPTTDAAYNALVANPARLTDVVPTYTRFDLGAGWTHPDGRLSINGFVNNVANIAYTTSINSNPGANTRYFNAPRTAGVRVRVDW
jgi:iron complex outermembrane receptor protein